MHSEVLFQFLDLFQGALVVFVHTECCFMLTYYLVNYSRCRIVSLRKIFIYKINKRL